MRIGFLGAGMMGSGMALNLIKCGHEVLVIAHRNRGPIDELVRNGAREAGSLESLAEESEAVILCLSTAEVVSETIERMKPRLRAGQIIIDTGTTAPETTRRLAHELSPLGIGYADAPLTGGPEQAAKAELGALVGADAETFARIRPVLACFASRIKHFGPPGSGHVAKLISNYLVIGMIGLVAEAFTTARKANVDWSDLYEVMLNGSGNSGVLRKMVEPALKGDFEGYRFSLANAAKDIGYYAELAEKLDRMTPFSEAVVEMFSEAARGHGGRNVSHLLDPAIDDVT
jgi:3-hydroxyisobutyrate dehydrogenase-like beta-hydroxyacid dehydrogenase